MGTVEVAVYHDKVVRDISLCPTQHPSRIEVRYGLERLRMSDFQSSTEIDEILPMSFPVSRPT